ncbi:MAG: 16S rRNA (cytidine(1402)-2'-O)-methyltransferase [Acidobacteria bacterium]|nr:16S rRNA (cytidine(1402)-2'-O)-methyltransferase [Acidobacteriota bacterium]
MSGTLYVVATPLGNLEDLTPRAARTLAEVDIIACEDTRHTRKLLNFLGLSKHMISYHEHNETTRAVSLVSELKSGKSIALVSDAGTPLVSDPGYRLVQLCRKEGIAVAPVPGPSAAIAALSVSGLPTDQFYFAGFLPRRRAAATRQLQELSSSKATLIFFLSPHGLVPALEKIHDVLGNRLCFLARELTKLHETVYFGPLQEVRSRIEVEPARGEYTLVVDGAPQPSAAPQSDPVALVEELMRSKGLSRKDAIREIAREHPVSVRDLYQRLHTRK